MSLSYELSAAIFTAIAAVPALGAALEPSTQGTPQTAASESQLTEVIVTARRREEKIQAVPIAITAVSQQTLQENNIETIKELQYVVPSMSIFTSTKPDRLDIEIRGQGTNLQTNRQGVVAYLNEVLLPSGEDGTISGGPGLFFDLENVQVLKGPQGTLFGRNSVGGALLLQSAKPKDELGGSLMLGYGNYNNREVEGLLNLPIVHDVLLARLAFTAEKRDGYSHFLSSPSHPNGVDADDRDTYAARASVSYRPASWVQNDTVLTFTSYDSHGGAYLLTHAEQGPLAGLLGPLAAEQRALGPRTGLGISVDDKSSARTFLASNATNIQLNDNLTLRNIFGYSLDRETTLGDLDGTPLPLIDYWASPYIIRSPQYTEELQLQGKSFGDHLQWTLGAFYLDQPFSDWAGQHLVVFSAPGNKEFRFGSKSKALFWQGTHDLSSILSGLKFTAGIRYTKDEIFTDSRPGYFSASGAPIYCGDPGAPPCAPDAPSIAKSHALTWTAGFDYQINPDTLIYLTSRRGYRPGGPSSLATDGVTAIPGFGPEYVADVEAGTKADWRLGKIPIRTNVDFFYQRYSDIQVSTTVFVGTVPNNVVQNAAQAREWGAELEATAELTDNLEFGVNFSYLNFAYTEFKSNVSAATITQSLGSPNGGHVPYKYGVNARYRLLTLPQSGELSLHANWNWQDTGGSIYQVYGGVIPAFGLLNMSADWTGIRNTPFDLSLYASNVLDKVYTVGGSNYIGAGLGLVFERFGEPRMYGIRVRYHFK